MTEAAAVSAPVAQTAPAHAIVWAEIPVSDLSRASTFYGAVLGWDLVKEQMGPNMTAVLPTADGQGVAGHLYEGKPSGDGRGPTVSLTVQDPLEQVMDRVWQAGGKVLGEVITIPFGSFFYATDPDGNSVSFFRF